MFENDDPTKVKILWYDGKMHTVYLNDGRDNVALSEVRKCYKEILENKVDKCKDIFYLGAALTGSTDGARGFLVGWLVRSIRDDMQARLEDGSRIAIHHEEEELSEDEIKSYVAEGLESLAKKVREDADFQPKKAPILSGGADGTEQYQ